MLPGALVAQDTVPPWARRARVGGLSLQSTASASEVTQKVTERKNQNVSVIELDSTLSQYLSDAQFDVEVAFIDQVATEAHTQGLKTVIYYPALEVVTPNGETLPNSMFKDHPGWVQYGIDGSPNVFYGSQEDWIAPGGESAWMSPNGPYRDYLTSRVRKIVQDSAVDGIWLDVPIYLDTGTGWADTGVHGAAAFQAWSAAEGYNGGSGYSSPPSAVNFNDAKFRVWLRWRHENLADFIEHLRVEAQAIDPDFLVVVETYPMDYMDTVWTGLDAAYMTSRGNFLRVWEVDSVSNVNAMKWSNKEDFSGKIAMYKYARAIDRDLPSWSFVYGNEPLDTGLTLAACVATKNTPFETKTPIMTETVSNELRTRWYDFVKKNTTALLETDRHAQVGVWFSAASREYQDMPAGAIYGMYLQSTPPTTDPDWWAQVQNLTLRNAPHLGSWRGAAHALHQLTIPYKCVSDPGEPAAELADVPLLWLPSVGCMSDASAQIVRDYVQQGGTVLATGLLPAVKDELGNPRSQSALTDVFGFDGATSSGPRMHDFGTGVAIYRPTLKGLDLLESEGGNSALADRTLGELETFLRIHTRDELIVDAPEGLFIEMSVPSTTEQHLYVVNYTGCVQPMISSPIALPIRYRAPEGFRVTGANVATPDLGGDNGVLDVLEVAEGVFEIKTRVDQFALITLDLAPATPSIPASYTVTFSSSERQEAVTSGLAFIRDRMRNTQLPVPYRYGVRTNLLDNDGPTEVYTGGHHVTAEHMGLYLRVTALLEDESAFQEGFEFVRDVLYSPGYHVIGWSMHKTDLTRFLQLDALNEVPTWLTANAPLDDLRAIHGLLDGGLLSGLDDARQLGRSALQGLYWTSVTDLKRGTPTLFPQYPGGLVGYSFDWEDQDLSSLSPPSMASGMARLSVEPLPIDYQELETITMAAAHDPRWRPMLRSAIDLLTDAEIPGSPGLFYNGLDPTAGSFTGDFEFPGERQGNNLKAIQELWTALHLKRVSDAAAYLVDDQRRQNAADAASRSFNFFKSFYLTNGRVPEYLTFGGDDVPDCGGTPFGDCLEVGVENLIDGEARIYAQLARLALLFGETAFAAQVIDERILADRVADPNDPRYGMIGTGAAGANDAEAWNTLESLLTLLLEARTLDGSPPANTAPTATDDNLVAGLGSPRALADVELLGNDTDPNGDILGLVAVDGATTAGGTVTSMATGYIYSPPAGFIGEDRFDYTVDDGHGGRDTGTAIVDVQDGIVTPPLGFVMDGDLGEWPNDASIGTDPNDISGTSNPLDLLEMLVTNDVEKVYMAYRMEADVQITYGFTLYMDTDQAFATGFGFWNIGADYVIQGRSLYQYGGTGTDWVWAYVGDVDLGMIGNILEFGFPRSWIGNPAAFDLVFYGDNSAYGGTAVDYFPDGVTGGGGPMFLTYVFGSEPVNNAPVAQGSSVTTPADTAVAVTLQASDPDGDSLTYQVSVAPTHGSLSGTAPALTYTPTTGFSGMDTFTFTVHDGALTSAPALVTITVEAPVPTSLAIDGNFADWTSIPAQGVENADIPDAANNLLDLLAIKISHDASSVYFLYENESTVQIGWAYSLFVDADQSSTTGFGFYSVGADYLIQGQYLFAYAGTGTDWAWSYVGQLNLATGGTRAEFAVSRTDIGNPDAFSWIFYGDNGAYGGSGVDLVPNGGSSSTYTISGSTPPPAFVVDGDLSEWTPAESAGTDPNDVSGPTNAVDLLELFVGKDASDVYFAYRNDGPVDLNWTYNLFIDVDRSTATGFSTYGLGADYLLQGGHLWGHNGAPGVWAWQYLGPVTTAVQGSGAELKVSLAALGSPGAFDFVFVGDNPSAGGDTVDLFPDAGVVTSP